MTPSPRARKPRETAAERDERVVREAGPWQVFRHNDGAWFSVSTAQMIRDRNMLDECRAAARILNRLRSKRKGGKP